MKVLYVVHSLIVGGAETVVVNYVLNLKARGQDVALLELSHADTFLAKKIKESNIPYYTALPKVNLLQRLIKKVWRRYTINKFNRVLKDISPDVIHFHTMFPEMDKVNFPINHCVFTYHSRVKRNFLSAKYIKPLMDRLVEKKINFVAISSEINNDIKQYFNNTYSTVIPNGMNLEEIRRNKYSRKEFCEELSIPQDAFLIGQVGRFNPVKNHTFTLKLFKAIINEYPNSYLLFVGSGNVEETCLINNRIKELGLTGKVILLGLRSDATSVMSCLDALLLPSKSEALPLVMIEAQALNVRCVASEAIPDDVICNPNCSRLSLDAPIKEWVQTVMGKNQEKNLHNLSDFDINVVVDKHLALYEYVREDC